MTSVSSGINCGDSEKWSTAVFGYKIRIDEGMRFQKEGREEQKDDWNGGLKVLRRWLLE